MSQDSQKEVDEDVVEAELEQQDYGHDQGDDDDELICREVSQVQQLPPVNQNLDASAPQTPLEQIQEDS